MAPTLRNRNGRRILESRNSPSIPSSPLTPLSSYTLPLRSSPIRGIPTSRNGAVASSNLDQQSSELSEFPDYLLESPIVEPEHIGLDSEGDDYDSDDSDASDNSDDSRSTSTARSFPPSPTPTRRQVLSRYGSQSRAIPSRRGQREQDTEARRESVIASIQNSIPTQSRKRGRASTAASNASGPLQSQTQHPRKKRRYPPHESEIKRILQDTRRYIKKKHNTSLTWIFEQIMSVKNAASWRTVFKRVFLAHSTRADNTVWVDEIVREQLQATGYRAVQLQLRKELFDFGEQIREAQRETESADTASTPSSLTVSEMWRDRLGGQLKLHALPVISQIERVKAVAPSWVHIILSAACGVVLNQRDRANHVIIPAGKNFQWVGATIANLCGHLQPKKSGILGRITGVFVLSQGISRLGIEYLYNLGICPSYDTINRSLHNIEANHAQVLRGVGQCLNRVVCYDNIQFKQGVRDKSVGEENKFHSFTTGFVKVSPYIPASGIKRSQFQPENPLQVCDILMWHREDDDASLNRDRHIWSYYIVTALQQVFPHLQTKSSGRGRPRKDAIPATLPGTASCLPPQVSNTLTLQELLFDESTESGNVEIKRDIHLRQFGLDEFATQWTDNLFLVFGDAMTAQRIQTMQSSLLMCDSDFDQAQWILPIIGLWHLRYNYVDLIIQQHFGGPADDTSTLYHAWHSIYTSKHVDKKSFDQMHKLITNAFDAKLVGLVLQYLTQNESAIAKEVRDNLMKDSPDNHVLTEIQRTDPVGEGSFTNTTDPIFQVYQLPGLATLDHEQMSQWIKHIPINTIAQAIQWAQERIEVTARADPYSETIAADNEFENNMRFLSNTMPYIVLSEAIKTANIEVLRHALKQTLIIFSGVSNRTTYQYELCRLIWLTCTSATDEELADIILKEGLVNTQGEKDTFYEMDRANELINFRLRVANNSRKTSSHPVERIIARQLRTDDTFNSIKQLVKKHFSIRQNNKHNVKDRTNLIWLLVHEQRRGSMGHISGLTETPGRGSTTSIDNLYRRGSQRIPQVVQRFNSIQRLWQTGLGSDIGEILQTHGQADIIASIIEDGLDEERHSGPLSEIEHLRRVISQKEAGTALSADTNQWVNIFQTDLTENSRARPASTQAVPSMTSLRMPDNEAEDDYLFENDIGGWNDCDFGDETGNARGDPILRDPLGQVVEDINVNSLNELEDDPHDDAIENDVMQLYGDADEASRPLHEEDNNCDDNNELDAQPGPEMDQLRRTFD